MPFTAYDPSTGHFIASHSTLDAAQREHLLARIHATQQRWRHHSVADRSVWVRALAFSLRNHREALADALSHEMGKPIIAARAEVDKCANLCDTAPALASVALVSGALVSETLSDGAVAHVEVRYQPLGTVLAIMPWNFPYWQALRFAVPTLLAGNGVVIKPAPSVPTSGLLLAQCMRDADTVAAREGAPVAPCDVAFVEQGDIDEVIADVRIVGVTLTGSDRAGRHVAQVAGAHLKKVVLELGGSDPFIVLDDADVVRAATIAVSARTVNSGQSCVAAKRFIVCDAVYDEFITRFVDGMRSLIVGDPRDEHTQIGPIATASVRAGLAAQVDRSVARGARVLLGGRPSDQPGFYYPPTVLVDIPDDAPASCEELFGPVAPVFRVRDVDEAISRANRSPYGLGASVWTSSSHHAERCIAELDAGMVFINDMVISDPRYPFGGVKQSGVGRELGPIGFREFTNQQTVRFLHRLPHPR